MGYTFHYLSQFACVYAIVLKTTIHLIAKHDRKSVPVTVSIIKKKSLKNHLVICDSQCDEKTQFLAKSIRIARFPDIQDPAIRGSTARYVFIEIDNVKRTTSLLPLVTCITALILTQLHKLRCIYTANMYFVLAFYFARDINIYYIYIYIYIQSSRQDRHRFR